MRKDRPVANIPADKLTVADAANLFLEETHQRALAQQVSWAYYRSSAGRLKRVIDCFGRDTPLSDIGKTELSRVVLHFASRPPCERRPHQRRPLGEPLAMATAKDFIRQAKTLFLWLAEHDDLEWTRPKGFNRIFRIKDRRMQTPIEQERAARIVTSGEVETFSRAELTRIFRAAKSMERLYVLLGLNCGFTSGEVSSLRTFEVFLDEERPFIHKRRSKTGVEAKWLLWPETVSLLRRNKAPANVDRRWLLTLEGNPLVEVSEWSRRDNIHRAWRLLLPRAGAPRWLGFRFLRKTGANAIKRLGGMEESEMFLAHQEPGLNKSYANRNWDRLWACLDKFRSQLPFLGPAWDLEPCECLFTQNGNPDWSEINPPFVQNVTKRSETSLLNVSLHKGKRRYYARIYHKGRTHVSKYFLRPEQAAAAAQVIRLELERTCEEATLRRMARRH